MFLTMEYDQLSIVAVDFRLVSVESRYPSLFYFIWKENENEIRLTQFICDNTQSVGILITRRYLSSKSKRKIKWKHEEKKPNYF